MMTDYGGVVSDLLATQREGQHWDFKELHHEKGASLVHDIVCLANTEHTGDRFILFGIQDGTYRVTGVEGSSCRRTQADIVDLLRRVPFTRGRRPEVSLHTLMVEGHQVDLLVIYNRPFKPYQLEKEYGKQDGKLLRAHHIYSRVLDTNTPVDSSADPSDVERMWRERFGLDNPPMKRMIGLLGDSNWSMDLGNRRIAFHHTFPEFRIEFSEPREVTEPYAIFFVNPSMSVGTAQFFYHSTVLFEEEYIVCDELRKWLPAPNGGCVYGSQGQMPYFYYNLDSEGGAFLRLLTAGSLDFRDHRGGEGPFLIFNTNEERRKFERYASTVDLRKHLEAVAASAAVAQRALDQTPFAHWSAASLLALRHLQVSGTWM